MGFKIDQTREFKLLSLKELEKIKTEFVRQSNQATKEKMESLAWYDSLIAPWEEGLETQKPVVVIDLGGSYLRTGVMIWTGKKFKWLKPIKKEKAVNEHLNPLGFINWLAKKTIPLIKESQAKRVGFIFSYPHQPQRFGPHVTGVVTQLTKALIIPGIKGVDIGKLYLKNLKQRQVYLKRLVILNDTVALALSEPGVIAGVVIGTGVNICSQHPKLKNLRNLESGSFDGIRQTAMSACVDLLEHQGAYLMEKQSSGRYQFRNWAYASLLTGMRVEIGREIMRQGRKIESLIVTEAYKGKFDYLKSLKLTQAEKKRLQQMAKIVLDNSAMMSGAAVAGVVKLNEKKLKGRLVRLAVTGGVILNDEEYLNNFRKTIEKLTKKKVEIIQVKDPIKGAAVAALKED